VSMAQMWTAIGIMATAFAAMIGFSYRAMTEQGKTLATRMDGLRAEFNAHFQGLRAEMNARFDNLTVRMDNLTMRVDKVESIDREVHALSIKVMGLGAPPRGD
jgi:hypothetical protein